MEEERMKDLLEGPERGPFSVGQMGYIDEG